MGGENGVVWVREVAANDAVWSREAKVVGKESAPWGFRVNRFESEVDRFLLGRVKGGLLFLLAGQEEEEREKGE